MTDLRTAAQQALECLKGVARGKYDGNAAEVCAALEAALAQQAEPVDTDCHTQGICQRSGYGITQQAEPVEPVAWLRVIDEAMVTHHLGVADPADDYETAKRKMNNLLCTAQDIGTFFAKTEPVQEPFGYLWPTGGHPEFRFTQQRRDGVDGTPVYTTPPQQAEPVASCGWLFRRNADGTIGIFAPPPKPGESQRTSDCVGPNNHDLHELLGKLADHMAAPPQQAEPVEPVEQPYCYVYEYDGAFGLHREFYPKVYNGHKPDRTVPLYTAPPQRKED